ncbi:DUF411 domain-containing protein [Delftia tsuruhatensis]|uniref:DUF411 domain-containing protein n=1 Tax=Delftia tsuruhatensis TaxID=180282 RepID=UPI0028A2B195|nr:DUF411 domain-containing protein [Delftia tsuruhatensis]
MTTLTLHRLTFVVLAVAGLGACTQDASSAQPTTSPSAQVVVQSADATPAALPRMTVHKTPTCGCCGVWIDHVQKAGFTVDVHDMDDLGLVKERLGVPYAKGSCHTAEIGGYVIEGHVPAADIKRLLEEKPNARGLVLPGMPLGSPGMEVPEGRQQPYTVELVHHDGTTEPFAQH